MYQPALGAGGGQRRRLGDAGNADFLLNGVRRVLQTRRFGLQAVTVEDPKRHGKHVRKRLQRGFVGFQVDAENPAIAAALMFARASSRITSSISSSAGHPRAQPTPSITSCGQ